MSLGTTQKGLGFTTSSLETQNEPAKTQNEPAQIIFKTPDRANRQQQPTTKPPRIMSSRHGGRTRPHERDTGNDNVEILGANIAVSAEHTASVKATERQDLNEKNRRDYRNQIKHIYE